MIRWFHSFPSDQIFPDAVQTQHPSVMCASLLPKITDQSVAKRMIICLLAALRANGTNRKILRRYTWICYRLDIFFSYFANPRKITFRFVRRVHTGRRYGEKSHRILQQVGIQRNFPRIERGHDLSRTTFLAF